MRYFWLSLTVSSTLFCSVLYITNCLFYSTIFSSKFKLRNLRKLIKRTPGQSTRNVVRWLRWSMLPCHIKHPPGKWVVFLFTCIKSQIHNFTQWCFHFRFSSEDKSRNYPTTEALVSMDMALRVYGQTEKYSRIQCFQNHHYALKYTTNSKLKAILKHLYWTRNFVRTPIYSYIYIL